MDDELGNQLMSLPLWNAIGLVVSMVIFVMGLAGLQDPEIYCCTAVTTIISLPLAILSLRYIFVAVHENGLRIQSLFGKRIVLWTEIAEIQVDHLVPYYITGQHSLPDLIDFMFSATVSMIRYAWIILQFLIPIRVSRYAFTLRDGKVVKVQGGLFFIQLEPIIVQRIARYLPDGTIDTTQRLFRLTRFYKLLDAPRKPIGQ